MVNILLPAPPDLLPSTHGGHKAMWRRAGRFPPLAPVNLLTAQGGQHWEQGWRMEHSPSKAVVLSLRNATALYSSSSCWGDPNPKIILLLLHDSHFAVMNCHVKYLTCRISDTPFL